MKQVAVRLSAREYEHLLKFCSTTQRNQSDVIREQIRKLSIKGVLNPLD
jgi:predicted DNA-binding protein